MFESQIEHYNKYEKDLIDLIDSKTKNKSLIEEQISKHLDDYLLHCSDKLMQLPMKNLINIFSNKSRLLKNENLAYQIIIKQSKNQDSSDISIFCLLSYLDAQKLNKKFIQESIDLSKERNFMMPKHTLKQFIQNEEEERERSRNESTKKQNHAKQRIIFIFILIFFFFVPLLISCFYSMRIRITQTEKLIDYLNESIQNLQINNTEMKEKIVKLEQDMEEMKEQISKSTRLARLAYGKP